MKVAGRAPPAGVLAPCAATLLAAAIVLVACAAPAREPSAAGRAAALADERGCSACHAEKAPPLGRGRMPIAPAWDEIAARYRRDPGAEEALVGAIVGGTEQRHWKGEPLVTMLPQEKWVAPEEARALVRWILDR